MICGPSRPLLGLFGLCAACTDGKPEEPADPVSPCADQSFGVLTDPSTAIHVRADGDDDADGAHATPVATLPRALELSRAAGTYQQIFVGPGEFKGPGSSIESAPLAGGSDEGLTLAGCPGEVTLTPALDDRFVVRVSEAVGVLLADLTLEGGDASLWIRSGAEVEARRVVARGAGAVGVLIDGHDTLVDAEDAEVEDTEGADDGWAPGVVVRGASLSWTGGRIAGSRGVGLFMDGESSASIALDGLEVSETQALDGGELGRAVHVQRVASLSAQDLSLQVSTDVALYVLQSYDTVIEGLSVESVNEGSDGEGTPTGDGLVLSSLDDSGLTYDPTLFPATVSDSVITGAARAGATLEGVLASLDGNTFSGAQYGLVSQLAAEIAGSDAAEATVLEDADALGLNRALLEADLDIDEE